MPMAANTDEKVLPEKEAVVTKIKKEYTTPIIPSTIEVIPKPRPGRIGFGT